MNEKIPMPKTSDGLSASSELSLDDLKTYACAVFDCDGVVLDSNEVKTDGFRMALDGYPADKVEALLDFHRQHGGESRYVKFEYFFRDLLGRDDIGGLVEELVKRFEQLIGAGLMTCPEIPGARAMLDWFNGIGTPCIMISGAAQVELRDVLERRGLASYFEGIYGSPPSKMEQLENLRKEHELPISNAVFFGDSSTDLEAAMAFGIDFVFVFGRSMWSDGKRICAAEQCSRIADFECLLKDDRDPTRRSPR